MRTSVVVPAYNERESLPQLLSEIDAVRERFGITEVIVVDDGSTDGTFGVLRSLAARYPWLSALRLRGNAGKAAALAIGFARATGDAIVTLDADLQDDPAEIGKLLEGLTGADCVVGWKTPRRDPWTKVLPSRVFNALVRRMTGLAIHDVNSGSKAMRRDVVRGIRMYGELHRFVPALARFAGFRVTEVAVHHRARQHGSSKYGARRFLRGLFDLCTVTFLARYGERPLHWFGGVGLVAIAFGTGIGAYLTTLHFAGQSIGDRPLLLLAILLLLGGLQLLFTGFLAELFVRGQGVPGPGVAERLNAPDAPVR